MSPSFFKRGGASAVKLKSANRTEINQYIQLLATQGYAVMGTPIEYRQPMSADQLRESAKAYAFQNGCSLVVEVQDPNPMANPYNPYKYYLFQYTAGPQPPEPMEPPSKGGVAVQQQQASQLFAEFACPYCQSNFTTYVNPGRNILTCPKCRGQSMVDVPHPNTMSNVDQGPQVSVQAQMSQIKLKASYPTPDQMAVDCLDVLGKMLMIEGNPIQFGDTGEFLYPFIRMRSAAYQHIGFRNMDMILLKEATHDFKIIGSEQHSQSQANVNPHKDELFSVKVLGGINFLVLEEFKALEEEQKRNILNAFYQFLTQYVGVSG